MPARQYRSTVEAKTLSAGINDSVTSITLNSVTTLPSTYPYTLVIDPDTATEEIVTVTANAGGTTLTVVRGQDGTSGQEHNPAAVVKHMITARDLQDAQNHIEASTGGYTIVSDGTGTTQNLHGIAAGEGAVVGTTKTQTLTSKTIDLDSNTLTGTITEFNNALQDDNFATINGTENLSNKFYVNPIVVSQVSTSSDTAYTLNSGDLGKNVLMTSSSANTVTVPLSSTLGATSSPLSPNRQITVIQAGTGATTIAPASGVSISYFSPTSASTRRLRGRYTAAVLIETGADSWILVGNLL